MNLSRQLSTHYSPYMTKIDSYLFPNWARIADSSRKSTRDPPDSIRIGATQLRFTDQATGIKSPIRQQDEWRDIGRGGAQKLRVEQEVAGNGLGRTQLLRQTSFVLRDDPIR